MGVLEMGPELLKSESGKVISAHANLVGYLNRIKSATDSVKGFYQDDEASKYFQAIDDFHEKSQALLNHVEDAGNFLKSVAVAAENISSSGKA